MPKSKKQIDSDYYKRKKEGGWIKFSKWVHVDSIEPITKDEILAFCNRKTQKAELLREKGSK